MQTPDGPVLPLSNAPVNKQGNAPAIAAGFRIAATEGDTSVIKKFLDEKVSIHCYDDGGCTVLYRAVEANKIDAVRQLLAAGASPTSLELSGDTALHLAAKKGFVEVLRVMLEANAKPDARNADWQTPLDIAVIQRQSDAIRILCSFGVSFAACEKPPLVRAAALNFSDIIPLLVELGAGINEVHELESAALHEAVLRGNMTAVQTLLALGADVNVGRGTLTPLHVAVHSSDEMLRRLLDAGVDLTARDSAGLTALHRFAGTGRLRACEMLLAAGAHVNDSAPTSAITPLVVATHRKQWKMVNLLLQRGAYPDVIVPTHVTPLYLCVKAGQLDTAEALIAAGADVNFPLSPSLHAAVMLEDPGMAALLLSVGADPLVRNPAGECARDVALRQVRNARFGGPGAVPGASAQLIYNPENIRRKTKIA